MTTDFTIISFSVCPFAQRSRVVMNAKGIDAQTVYIDLDNKPDWFLDRVPTGKVPALFVGERTLFESAAINEYLDETSLGDALGETPLERAEARAWIALSDDAVMAQYRALIAPSETELDLAVDQLATALQRFEPVAAGRADAENITLLDAAIAPVFTRNAVVPAIDERLTPKTGAARNIAEMRIKGQ